MPNNITGNSPNGVVATVTSETLFSAIAIINSTNIVEIFWVDRTRKVYKSYKPGRGINQINSFKPGESYLIFSNSDLDLSAYVGPPFPVTTGGSNFLISIDS